MYVIFFIIKVKRGFELIFINYFVYKRSFYLFKFCMSLKNVSLLNRILDMFISIFFL